jgi:hypothetical protein
VDYIDKYLEDVEEALDDALDAVKAAYVFPFALWDETPPPGIPALHAWLVGEIIKDIDNEDIDVDVVRVGTATTAAAYFGNFTVTLTHSVDERERTVAFRLQAAPVDVEATEFLEDLLEDLGLDEDELEDLLEALKEDAAVALHALLVLQGEFIFKGEKAGEDYILALYKYLLGRDDDVKKDDAEAFAGWLKWFEELGDAGPAILFDSFISLPEFGKHMASIGIKADPVRLFVGRLYVKVLGWWGDFDGVGYWIKAINGVRDPNFPELSGVPNLEGVVQGFFFGWDVELPAAPDKFVELAYEGIYGRKPSDAESVKWVGELAGGMDRKDVVSGILDEFMTNVKPW